MHAEYAISPASFVVYGFANCGVRILQSLLDLARLLSFYSGYVCVGCDSSLV